MSDHISPDQLREVLLKLELTQFARGELHVIKEDLREILHRDLNDHRRELRDRNRKFISIVLTTAAVIIGGDVWTIRDTAHRARDTVNAEITAMQERSRQALAAEVQRIQHDVSVRLDKEFSEPHIRELVEQKAREYTEVEARSYIATQMEKGLKPFHEQVATYKAKVGEAFDQLAQEREVAELGDDAAAGSRKSYDLLVTISRGHTPEATRAAERLASVVKSYSVYLKPDIGAALQLSFNSPDGKTHMEQELSPTELFGALSNEVDLPDDRRKIIGYLAKRPKDQLIDPALGVLRNSPYLPGVAATCGVLRYVFGEKAKFLDIDGWIQFLEKERGKK